MNEFTEYIKNIDFDKKISIIEESERFKETGILENGELRIAARDLGKMTGENAMYFTDVVTKELTMEFALIYINQLKATA